MVTKSYGAYMGESNVGINSTSTDTFDISDKHNIEGYLYISNMCTHTQKPYEGYEPYSYIYLNQAYLEK